MAVLLFALVGGAGVAQAPVPALQAPMPWPADRVADSYAIYSELLPGNAIEWGDAPRTFWLLEDTTQGVPLDQTCASGGGMNPHEAIRAPEARRAEFAEVLADFDARCHERYTLAADQFHLRLPVRLLDAAGQKRYVSHVMHFLPPKDNIMQAPPTPEEFRGAAGMHRFTAVYFNPAHTLAMTEIGMYCGGLCGNWSWAVLERKDGAWHSLRWVVMSTIS